ncbi:MAG: N-acetylmuramoyl-L-alanine amidase [Verrucomicrobia bacterium]|nr:N-acetylmuramoyl-L-alanine amidase [Verrucomicrobiota bacterium]
MNTRKNIIRPLFIAAATLLLSPELIAQTTKAPQPTICTRACWGAAASSCTTTISALSRAIIHHTENSNDFNVTSLDGSKSRMRATQSYHQNTLGWCDIGYHFTVDKFGNIFEARANSMSGLPRGAHDGCNANSFGFSCLGNFNPGINVPPTAMRSALYDVIAWRMPNGWSPYGSGTYCGVTAGYTDGHRVVSTKTCPGDNVYQYITTNYSGGEARNGIAARRTTAVIVDNNASGFTASSTWVTATSAPDKYGSDYRFRSTQAISDAATWTVNLGSTKTYSVHAWWSAGTNRSASAPYIVYHASGSTTVAKNQQSNGGSWQSLGSWSMNAGSNQVKLSCWTTTGYVVIADAIKWQ